MMMASSLAKSIRAHVPKESDSAQRIARLTGEAIDLARNLARGLHPVTLASHGLPAALGELAERVPLEVDFNWPKSKRLDLEPAVALHLYRIAEEAVANAVRHAKAKKITIELRFHAKRGVTLAIADNGKGFDPSIASEGMGLRNMKYRAGAIGAALTIAAKPREGTRVSCSVPFPDSRRSAASIKRRKQIRGKP
jgi:signal transduction histidine kinase